MLQYVWATDTVENTVLAFVKEKLGCALFGVTAHTVVSCVYFSILSEFELPWFDLDVREAKENVRTTRSMAKATRSSASSSGRAPSNHVVL